MGEPGERANIDFEQDKSALLKNTSTTAKAHMKVRVTGTTRTRYDSRLLLANLGRLDKLGHKRRVAEASQSLDVRLEELAQAPELCLSDEEASDEEGFDVE